MSSNKTCQHSVGNSSVSPRIVTVCVHGANRRSVKQNGASNRIVADVVKGIRQQSWSKIDCVVFPGGFFFLPKYIGNLSHEDRVNVLEAMDFANTLRDACSELQKHNPGLSVVAGVDLTLCPDGKDRGRDQTCVAWTPNGIVGIGRKIFPVPGGDSRKFVSYSPDFSTIHRIISLPSGSKAVLCACYDLFGCSESLAHRTERTKYIVCIEKNGTKFQGSLREFLDLRDKCVNDWHKLLVSNNVNVGIAAIHSFNKPGLDLFWQRHGIATCSAALNGGMAVGAAFFHQELPSPNKSSLVSTRVPASHIREGKHRQAHRLSPENFFNVDGALVRLFDG